MRHSFVRSLRVVLLVFFFFFYLLVPSFGQNQDANAKKKQAPSSRKAGAEKVLKADEGPAIRVKTPIRKDRRTPSAGGGQNQDQGDSQPAEAPSFRVMSHPREDRLVRGHSFEGDVRTLPQIAPEKFERPEFEAPKIAPVPYPGTGTPSAASQIPATATSNPPLPAIPMPTPSSSFDGLDFLNWGAGHPPDTNGDVGPTYYIQTINTSIGIFRKSDGVRVAAFTFNTFFNGHFGNLCDTNNFGDPVVLYDTFENRWVITDFAFILSGNPAAPVFQCFAVSQSGDPVGGGWNFYSIQTASTPADAFDDYPKFGIWPDGLYMSANMFAITGGSFQNVRVWAFNKTQMYAGNPTVQIVSFDAPSAEFTMLPSNARLQAGTPPAGTPNYFTTVFNFTNAVSTYKFHVDWNNTSASTFSGPFITIAPTTWANAPSNVATPSPGTNIDTLAPRLMAQNQYTNISGMESLWDSHTVLGGAASTAAPRYYQVDVTGGTVAANTTQAATFTPDTTVNRFMPSLAVDRAGDMAIGYSGASASLNPAMRYAGRLAGDPLNTLPQTETSLIEGTGTQQTASFTRWGDYSAMSLDPDGCTFWNTNMYYQANGVNFNTRIGAFSFPSCTPVGGGGAVSGTVTAAGSGNPISGATVALGARVTTTAIDGTYSFPSLPSGTYPSITASFPGYNSRTVTSLLVSDGLTTTQDFSLTQAPTNGCLVDTTQADFQAGVATNCDLISSPGDVILSSAPSINQQNTTLGNIGAGITVTTWGGQTFTPSVAGQLTRADINLFCSGCTGTTPDLILSLRATSGGLPTGADLVSATVTGFNSGAAGFHTATFSSPPTLTAGTQYALVIRPTANPSAGTYALTRSGTSTTGADVYPGGTRVSGATSGTVWSIPLTGGVSSDAGFKVFLQTGFGSSGTFVSSLKDANPANGSTANWGTISWTASTPANTAIQFQVAVSNNAAGPFNFVGPDGTAGTFFSNGGSLTQFKGNRYLKYQASLTTTDSTATPSLHDVTICFNDVSGATLTVAPASGTYGGTANLSATLTANSTGVSGKTVNFTLNGNSAGSGVTDASGTATVSGASLTGINAGSYPNGVAAIFAGDGSYTASSGSAALTVAKADQTITFGALAGRTFGDADFTVSATASSSLAVSFGASGNCSVTGSTVHITGAGSCTIMASQTGDANHNAATDVPQTFSIAKGNQTITFGALASKTFGDPDFALSAAASSGLTVTFGATGNCSVTGSVVHITGAGSCTITASQAGNANVNPAADVPQSLTIGKATPLVTPACPVPIFDGNPHACIAAATGVGNVTVAGTVAITYNTSATPPANAGAYAVSASFSSGDPNYSDATGSGSLIIGKAVPTVGVTCPSGVIFDGNTHACSATATGVGNAAVGGSLSLKYNGGPPPANAGAYTVGALFTSADPNYNDSAGSGSLTIAKANQTITFAALPNKTLGQPDFTVSASASSALAVSFAATTATCSVSGSAVHLTSAGLCTIKASQAGNGNFNAAADVSQSFTINPGDDFNIAPTLSSIAVIAGQSAIEHITVMPNPSTLTALIFSCSGLPAKTACSFAPNPVPPGSTPTDVVMTITTTATTTSALERPRVFYAAWLGFTSLGLMGVIVMGSRKKGRRAVVILGALSLMAVLLAVGCGGSPQPHNPVTVPGTPAGTSTITVSGSTTSFTHSTTFTLTVD
jgi:Carboxypeptidase regulatory-like domain/MBG domain